jgi:hypothetical protein
VYIMVVERCRGSILGLRVQELMRDDLRLLYYTSIPLRKSAMSEQYDDS